MTDTWASRYTPAHVPAGSPAGGQFAPASGSSQAGKNAGDKRPTPGNQHPVGTGETGKRVSDLQARLNALGFKPALKLDGILGPKTPAALRAKPAAKQKPAHAPAKATQAKATQAKTTLAALARPAAHRALA